MVRGYDVNTDEVRSMVLISLLGSSGAALLSQTGVEVVKRAPSACRRRLQHRDDDTVAAFAKRNSPATTPRK